MLNHILKKISHLISLLVFIIKERIKWDQKKSEAPIMNYSVGNEKILKTIKELKRKMIFIENEKHYHDFYLMSLCKLSIVGNSGFSWRTTYLNTNSNKKVIIPKAERGEKICLSK